MGRTACTEPQCLYKGALYLLNLHLTFMSLLSSLLLFCHLSSCSFISVSISYFHAYAHFFWFVLFYVSVFVLFLCFSLSVFFSLFFPLSGLLSVFCPLLPISYNFCFLFTRSTTQSELLLRLTMYM